jgi:tRNA nucleotidyltransferase/poly(A) polymerase
MSKSKELYRKIPSNIRTALILSDGWLVGSSIQSLLEDRPVKDYDIIVPVTNWETVMLGIKHWPHTFNTFGGLKFEVLTHDGIVELDIWPQDVDRFIKSSSKITYIYNLRNQILLELV